MVSELRRSGENRFLIGRAADLPAGKRRIVRAHGHEIGIFNVDGEYYALRNRCPHRGGPLCRGRVRPLVVASAEYTCAYKREDEILKCPWHQWEFDIKTGVALCDRDLRARTYPVTREGDQIFLHIA